MNKLELMKMANEIRKGAVTAVYHAKSGHPGGSLSAADIYTYLFFEEMNVDPADPKKADRDRFVLSKGHTAPGYYATLANRGFFPVEESDNTSSCGILSSGTSGHEAHSWCRYVKRISRTGDLSSSWNGDRSKAFRR